MTDDGIEQASASGSTLVRILVAQGLFFLCVLWVWRYVAFSGWAIARWVSPLGVGHTPLTVALLVAGGSLLCARGLWIGAEWVSPLLTVTSVGVVLATAFQLYMGIRCGLGSGIVLFLPMLVCCAGSFWVLDHVRAQSQAT